MKVSREYSHAVALLLLSLVDQFAAEAFVPRPPMAFHGVRQRYGTHKTRLYLRRDESKHDR
jgi:hypothetical protein